MKSIVFNCLIFFSISILANENINFCDVEYRSFGKRKMPTNCLDIYRQNLSGNSSKSTSSYQLLTSNNGLFLIKKGKVHIQAGEYAKINSPLSSAYSEEENLIATIESGGIVKLYNGAVMGNTAPIKVFEDPRLYGATDLVFTQSGLAILNPMTKKVLFIDHQMKVNPSLESEKEVLTHSLSFQDNHIVSISYDAETREILLIDQEDQAFTIKL